MKVSTYTCLFVHVLDMHVQHHQPEGPVKGVARIMSSRKHLLRPDKHGFLSKPMGELQTFVVSLFGLYEKCWTCSSLVVAQQSAL